MGKLAQFELQDKKIIMLASFNEKFIRFGLENDF